jgi:hypothetical protein
MTETVTLRPRATPSYTCLRIQYFTKHDNILPVAAAMSALDGKRTLGGHWCSRINLEIPFRSEMRASVIPARHSK